MLVGVLASFLLFPKDCITENVETCSLHWHLPINVTNMQMYYFINNYWVYLATDACKK